MAQTNNVYKTMSELERSFSNRMAEFEGQLASVGESTPKDSSIKQLRDDFVQFKNHIYTMFGLLRQQIGQLTASVDRLEMRHRKKFLLFGHIEEKSNEVPKEIIMDVLQKHLKLKDCTTEDFTVCHRLGSPADGRQRPMLVKFRDPSTRSLIWSKKSLFKGTTYVVSEYLTRTRQIIFHQARKHFGINHVWSMEGVINIKLPDGSRTKIFTEHDLLYLMAKHKAVGQPDPKAESIVITRPTKDVKKLPARSTRKH